MPAYDFDVGNTLTGPIGFCATIHAGSKIDAVTRLKQCLPREIYVEAHQVEYPLLPGERISIYINPDKIKAQPSVIRSE